MSMEADPLIPNDENENSSDEDDFLLSTSWEKEISKLDETFLTGDEPYSKTSIYGEVTGTVPVTDSHMIDATLESLDYDLGKKRKATTNYSLALQTCTGNSFLRRKHEERSLAYSSVLTKLLRWFLLLITGILPAFVAIAINLAIKYISAIKFKFLRTLLDDRFVKGSMVYPFAVWISLSWSIALIAGLLVAFVEPQAAGSGIPQIKAYLNGISVPRLMRLKTLFAKTFGVVCSVLAGLAVGKEGPMIHSGAAIGAGVSQGKSSSLGLDFIGSSFFYKAFAHYRNDREKRDFIACGAAAGVAAAFGAPFGGVLFALEEGNSHFDPYLMWKITFASTTSYFTLNLIDSFIEGVPGKLSSGGLISFGKFDDADYGYETVPILVLYGIVGGLLGAFYIKLNEIYTKIRLKYFQNSFIKVLDVMFIAGLSAVLGSIMFLAWNECVDLPPEKHPYFHPLQLSCPGGQYNVIANLWFATPEEVVKDLLHAHADHYKVNTLLIFGMAYFVLAFATYGLSISSGVFVPSILIGCTWGRALGILLRKYVTFVDWGQDVGKFALFGAAAQLSGNVRMMVSLTLIIIESTGNLTYSFPLVIVCIVAKYTGDFFNEGLYETHSNLNGVPYLSWRPPVGARNLLARHIMTRPLVTMQMTESLERVWALLSCTSHNGFPVVDPKEDDDAVPGTKTQINFGRFRGLILRDQILTMLHYGLFSDHQVVQDNGVEISWETLRSLYPRYPKIDSMHFSPEIIKSKNMDFRKVMNHSPYTVNANTSVEDVFRLFRLVGLRHLVVLNDSGECVGIITRQDLASIDEHGHKKRVFVPANTNDLKDLGPVIQRKFKNE